MSSISMSLAAARQAAALATYAGKSGGPQREAASSSEGAGQQARTASAAPVEPAKPAGAGLLVDKRI